MLNQNRAGRAYAVFPQPWKIAGFPAGRRVQTPVSRESGPFQRVSLRGLALLCRPPVTPSSPCLPFILGIAIRSLAVVGLNAISNALVIVASKTEYILIALSALTVEYARSSNT